MVRLSDIIFLSGGKIAACATHHDHLVCVRCRQVEEFCDEAIETRQRAIANRADFDVEEHSMVLYGLCRHCQQTPAED